MRELVKLLEEQVSESDSSAFDVGEQRERNMRYQTLQPLGNEQPGRSHYIDPSVLDAVQSKKSLFSETFLSNRQTVKFVSTGAQSAFEADAKTAYALQALRRNKHEKLFRDGWHDAFVTKRMVVVARWKQDTRDVTLNVQGAMAPQIQQLIASQGQVVDVDTSQLQSQNMPSVQGQVQIFQGSLTVTIDDSYCALELLQPERYYRDPLATYPDDSAWCAYELDMTRGELIRDGYDPEQINSLSVDYRFRSNEEDSARKAHDQSWTRRSQYGREDNQQPVTTYKTWTWLDLSDDEYADYEMEFQPEAGERLYEIHWAHGEVLKTQDGMMAIYEAEEMPFFEWSEMKISHAEHGLCTADVMAHTQKTQSTLKRLIIDNQQMRNNTRYEAVSGALKNPRDLLDSKIGGVIWSRAVGSVAPLATPELSPLTMGVIDMLRQDGERRDGYSGLGKGTNNDAIRYQNADSMIERLTTAGTRRPMMDARDWALTFLVPLCQYIVRLGMENDQSSNQMEIGGRMITIAPQQWSDDELMMDVAVALTPQEGKEHAQMMMMMHQVMSQDEQLSTLYGVNQRHALMDSVFDAMGVSDTTPYMQRPDSPEYKQQSQQAQQMAMQEKQKQEQLLMMQVKMAQSADRRAWDELEWRKTNEMDKNNRDERTLEHTISNDNNKLALDWTEFNQKSEMDEKELRLEASQERPVSVGN